MTIPMRSLRSRLTAPERTDLRLTLTNVNAGFFLHYCNVSELPALGSQLDCQTALSNHIDLHLQEFQNLLVVRISMLR